MQYLRLQWKNGQPYSELYDDVYYSNQGGLDESQHVFIAANQLEQRFSDCTQFTIAEIGLGTGLNFMLAAKQFLQHAPHTAMLDYVAIEKHVIHPDDIQQHASRYPEFEQCYAELLRQYPLPATGVYRCVLFQGQVRLTIIVGDVADAVAQHTWLVDAWFLDGFSPASNCAMWSQQLFDFMATCSHAGTTLATYTVAGAVRRGLQKSGFHINRLPGFGRKREMLVGQFSSEQDNRLYSRPDAPWYALPQQYAVARASAQKTAAIVGAGVSGLMTAKQLIERGWKIKLIDGAGDIAAGASGNAAGIVMPRLSIDNAIDNTFYMQAFRYACQQYRDVQRLHVEKFWFETGAVCGFKQDKAKRLLQSMGNALQTCHIDYAEDTLQWLSFVDAGWLRPRALCQALWQQHKDDIELINDTVVDVHNANHSVSLLNADGQQVADTDIVIFANASGVRYIKAFAYLNVQASRGQVVELEQQHVNEAIEQPLSASAYITPMFKGKAVAGASYSDTLTTALSLRDQNDIIEQLNMHFSGLLNMPPLSGRVSQRAVSQDRVPVVGAAPDPAYFHSEYHDLRHGKPPQHYANAKHMQGVYLNVAHGSRGFCSSFLCAEIIASMVQGSVLPVSWQVLDYLNPSRFLVKQLKRRSS